MDSEEYAVMCSGGSKISGVKIKKEPQSSERTCREIKPELDSDDTLQNQRVPLYSIMEYKNPDVTSDDGAIDMKTEIKEESWWDGSISPDKFQPELLLSHVHMGGALEKRTNNEHLPAKSRRRERMPKGKNFTEAEKMLLEELVIQHRSIIENKQTDSFTIQKKKATWNRITCEFNARLKNSRKDVAQLKKLWENIKFRRKSDRKCMPQTDSGRHSASTSDKNYQIDSPNSITIELNHTSDSESFLLEPQTLMIVEDSSLHNTEDMPVNPSCNFKEEQDMINGESVNKSTLSEELQLRIKKEKYLLQLEQQMGQQRKLEQTVHYELAKVKLEAARHQLFCARNEEQFQQERRRLELEILKKRLRE